MTKIAKISLDIRKNNVVDNEPIILRQGDSDVTIEASISNDGYPDIEIEFATFVAKKPDGTIVSNDPANVNGSVIDYPVSEHLTESVGNIQDAYFMINNEVTTCGFDISVIPSTQLDGSSVNYIPGLENINKFLKDTETDWLGRIQQMKSQIAGLDIPTEFKLLMNNSLDEAKAQYQPIIDAAEENVENIVADLAAKKLDLESNSDELNKTIATIKAQVASINSFLDNIQKQIIEANSSFTAGQQAQVSQSIADGQKKLADSIASMQSKFETDSNNLKSQVAQTIADLKNSSNSAITDMQNNQSTAMAKVNQDITDTKAIMQKLQISAVGTNLLKNTGISSTSTTTIWSVLFDSSQVYDSGIKSLSGVSAMTFSFDVYIPSNAEVGSEIPIQFKGQNSQALSPMNDDWNTLLSLSNYFIKQSDLGKTIRASYQILKGYKYQSFDTALADTASIVIRQSAETPGFVYSKIKLEKGSVATDYSLNPLDISTSESVQTAITNALSDVNAKVKELETKIDKLSQGKQ